jgi:hypothetical protein
MKRFNVLDLKYQISQGMSWSSVVYEMSDWTLLETRVSWIGIWESVHTGFGICFKDMDIHFISYIFMFKITLEKFKAIDILQKNISTLLPVRRLNLRLLPVSKLKCHVT